MENSITQTPSKDFIDVWGRRVLYGTLVFFLWWPVWQFIFAELTGFYLVSRQIVLVFTVLFIFEFVWWLLLQTVRKRMFVNVKAFFKVHKEVWLLVGILLWGLLSCCFAISPAVAFLGKTERGYLQLEAYWTYICYALIFVMAFLFIPKHKQKRMVYSFFAMLGVIAFFTILDPQGEKFVAFENHTSTWAGMFVNSNHFAYLLCMAVVGCIWLYITSSCMYCKWAWFAASIYFMVVLLFNNTLGSFLAVVVVLLIITGYYAWTQRAKALQSAGMLVLLFLLSGLVNQGKMAESFCRMIYEALRILTSLLGISCQWLENMPGGADVPLEDLGTNRWGLWVYSFKNIIAFPLFGVGIQCFSLANPMASSTRPHNEFLQFTGEMGVPVGIMYVLFIVWIAKKYFLQKSHTLVQDISFWMLCTYVISSLFGNTMPHTEPYICILLAILLQNLQPVLPKKERKLLAKSRKNEYIYTYIQNKKNWQNRRKETLC